MNDLWTQDLSIGDDNIDNQHAELLQLATLLDQALHEKDGHTIGQIIIFLEDYVVTHFKEEEDLMEASDYSELDEHRRDHERFKLKVAELRSIYDEGIKKAHLFFKVRNFLDDLIHHIKTIDVHLTSLRAR